MSRLGGAGDLNLPFEPSSGYFLDEDALIASGCVVMAAVVPVPDAEPMPALIFRFANPDGSGFYKPTVLVLDDGEMPGVVGLVAEAALAAITAAEKARLP